MKPLTLIASGMVTGIGLNAPASCAAMRCNINNFVETRFMDTGGEWITGSYVPLEQPWRGLAKLSRLAARAMQECLDAVPNADPEKVPVLLCVSEKDRPGRLKGLETELFHLVETELGLHFHKNSCVIPEGRVSGVRAAAQAVNLIYDKKHKNCIIAGADTFMTAGTLLAYEQKDRLLTAQNSNGFIPGEAGAAVLLSPLYKKAEPQMAILGIGFGKEAAHIDSEMPLRADGLVQAIKSALADAGQSLGNLDFRITDANGEQYPFKEAALALTRILRQRKAEFDIWHPADGIGEVGAATVPCVLGMAMAAAQKRYLPGNNILCHFGNDAGERAAMILNFRTYGGA